GATRALERLAELAQRAGQSDRVADLRRRKAEVERSLAGYRLRLWSDEPLRTAGERSELARLAVAAGRRHEARALFTWALNADPGDLSAREALVGLDRADAERQVALSSDIEPWPDPAPAHRAAGADLCPGIVERVTFTDDAESVGLRFVYDNAETALHQLP